MYRHILANSGIRLSGKIARYKIQKGFKQLKWPSRSFKVIGIDTIRLNTYDLVFHWKHVSLVHRFRDVISYSAYVTSCNLKKSFNFDTSVKTIGYVCAFWPVRKYILANTDSIFRSIWFTKPSNIQCDVQGHSRLWTLTTLDMCYIIMLVFHCHCVSVSYRLQDIITFSES